MEKHQDKTAVHKYPVILSIAGSDCSGGAGIQADIKAISACGGYAASAITAVTVQNTADGVTDIFPLPAKIIEEQITAVMGDLAPDAVKIGMVNDTQTVGAITSVLKKYDPAHTVYDPVMVSTSGHKLMQDETIETIRKSLIPLAGLITPNIQEAQVLSGMAINDIKGMEAAAKKIHTECGISVLVKGGRKDNGKYSVDLLFHDGQAHEFSASLIDSRNTHGTGCTLSSAIATFLAIGNSMEESVRKAKEYVHSCIREGRDLRIGHGYGPLWHFPAKEERQ